MAREWLARHVLPDDLHWLLMNGSQQEPLFEKIRSLSSEKRVELEDFVDFLCQRDEGRRVAEAVMRASEESFTKVWDNDADADYDDL